MPALARSREVRCPLSVVCLLPELQRTLLTRWTTVRCSPPRDTLPQFCCSEMPMHFGIGWADRAWAVPIALFVIAASGLSIRSRLHRFAFRGTDHPHPGVKIRPAGGPDGLA